MKIYIAGPMTDVVEHNFPAFREAAVQLRKEGHEVVCPAELDEITDAFDGIGKYPRPDHRFFMKRDLPIVMECDGIYLLPGWEQSVGALAELMTARACGLTILFHPEAEGQDGQICLVLFFHKNSDAERTDDS